MTSIEKAAEIADKIRRITAMRGDCQSLRGIILTPEEILDKCSCVEELNFYYNKLRKGGE